MLKVYVLIVTDPGADRSVAQKLKEIGVVTQVNEVMGPYDIVAELEVTNLNEIAPILDQRIRTIKGIVSTTSLPSIS